MADHQQDLRQHWRKISGALVAIGVLASEHRRDDEPIVSDFALTSAAVIDESAGPTSKRGSGASLNLYSRNRPLGKWLPGRHTCLSSVATLNFELLAIDMPGPAGIPPYKPSCSALGTRYLQVSFVRVPPEESSQILQLHRRSGPAGLQAKANAFTSSLSSLDAAPQHVPANTSGSQAFSQLASPRTSPSPSHEHGFAAIVRRELPALKPVGRASIVSSSSSIHQH